MSLVISIILYKLPKYMDFLFRHMDNSVKKNIAIIGCLYVLYKNKFNFCARFTVYFLGFTSIYKIFFHAVEKNRIHFANRLNYYKIVKNWTESPYIRYCPAFALRS